MYLELKDLEFLIKSDVEMNYLRNMVKEFMKKHQIR